MGFFGATEKEWQALDYFSNAQEKPDGPMCGQPNHVSFLMWNFTLLFPALWPLLNLLWSKYSNVF